MILEHWEKDPEFQVLPEEEKTRILLNFFDEKMADDEFQSLPLLDQYQIQQNFLKSEGAAPHKFPGLPMKPGVFEGEIEEPTEEEVAQMETQRAGELERAGSFAGQVLSAGPRLPSLRREETPEVVPTEGTTVPLQEQPRPSGAERSFDISPIEAAEEGLAHGTYGLAKAVGVGLQYMGTKFGSEALKKKGEVVSRYWEKGQKETEPPPQIAGSIFKKPGLLKDPAWWAYSIGDTLPSIEISMVPGVAAAGTIQIAGTALRWSPQLITRLASLGAGIVGGATGGSLEGTHTYETVIERGGTEEEAAQAAELMTLASGALNAISVGKAMSPGATGRLLHFLKTGATEALTEYAEEPAEALILKESKADILARMQEGINVIPPSFILGAGMGAVGREVVETKPPEVPGEPIAPKEEKVVKPPKEEKPPEEVKVAPPAPKEAVQEAPGRTIPEEQGVMPTPPEEVAGKARIPEGEAKPEALPPPVEPKPTRPTREPTRKPAKPTRKPEKPIFPQTQKLIQKFRKSADSLTKQIEAKRAPAIGEQRPTARRARITAGMAADADNLELIQIKLNALADTYEQGNTPSSLIGIKTRKHIEYLNREIHLQKKYADHKVKYPAVRKGDYDHVQEMESESLKLLKSAGINNQAQLDQALRDLDALGVKKPAEPSQKQRIAQLERDLIGRKIPGFFTTPKAVTEKLVDMAAITEPGLKILEPSAGKGNIADAIKELISERKVGGELSVIEINSTLRDILEAKGHKVIDTDFLEHHGEKYDRIIMNPPFEKGADIDHVRHAYALLNPGGRVISIMGEGVFFRSDKKSTDFREWLEDFEGVSEKLPQGTFKKEAAGTGTAGRIVTVDKPAETESGKAPSEKQKGGLFEKEEAGLPFESKVKEVEKELGSKVDEVIGEVSPKVGLQTQWVGTAAAVAPRTKFRFMDKAIEQRFRQAQGVTTPSFWRKLRSLFTSLKNKATRVYEHLPRTKEYAQLRFDLLKLSKSKGVAGDRAIRALQGITLNLDRAGYNLFSRQVILEDLKTVAEEEKSLPFGFDKETIEQELDRINDAIKNEPTIQESILARGRLWDAMKSDYTEAMQAIGFDVSKKLTREKYFRHQVLEYVNAKGLYGAGRKIRTPAYRGFLRKREGSQLDINTDYIQAEYEVLAQMLYDIEVAKTIQDVDRHYNIAPKLKTEAKKRNVPWESLIPEDYTVWQPREGNTFYMADSIPAKLADELTSGALGELGITPSDLRKVFALGGRRREFVVKEEIAETLDNLNPPKSHNMFAQASRAILRSWKVWTLISPRRFAKYNFRNLTGDADAAFVGNPSAFAKIPQAMKDLYDVYAGNKAMTPDMKDWFERGGMQSTLQVQEMGELNKLDIFKKLQRKGLDISEIPTVLWKKYWRAARLSTDFRESILRYAAYLDYLKQMQKDPKGKPKNFGASIPEEIMGLEDIRDRAFWLSNDLLGAYDRVSTMGQALREHLYPFWSWKEVNFKRYIQFMRNAANDGRLAPAVGRKLAGTAARSPIIAFRVGKFAIKATAFWAMLQVWNNLRFPEEEKDLPEQVRGRPHIIFGRDKKGEIIYFSRIGALGDFLEWFGLDEAPNFVDQYFRGKKSIKEIASEMAKSPVNQIVQGITPFAKVPAETISRRSLFPDVFKPGTVRDRGLHIARSLGLENEWLAISERPSRPYKETIPQFFTYRVDPYQAAYRDIFEEKMRFMKKIGKYGEGFWITPRGNVLYNFKLALRYKDLPAAQKYLIEYIKLGGTDKGLARSLEYLNPFSGMNEAQKLAFALSLDDQGKRKAIMAIKFWTDTLLGGEGSWNLEAQAISKKKDINFKMFFKREKRQKQ